MRVKELAKNVALSAGSLFLFVGLLEITLRFCGYGNVEIYDPDPLLYWRLKPNQTCYTKVDHKLVHINSQGTRGPEFSIAKPANTIRLLSLGDSRTFGWGMTEAETYSGLLEQSLREKFGSKRNVEVINAGVNAWGFPQMEVFFREIGLKYQPDFVIVGEANLWTQFSEKNSPEFVRTFLFRVRLKNFLRRFALYHYIVEVQLKGVYERYRTKFIPVDPKQDALFKSQQQHDPEAVFRSSIESISKLALANKAKPILLYLPVLGFVEATNRQGGFNAKQQLSKQLDLPLVDVTPNITGKGLYLDADPVHFNVQGNRIVARRLFDAISPLMPP